MVQLGGRLSGHHPIDSPGLCCPGTPCKLRSALVGCREDSPEPGQGPAVPWARPGAVRMDPAPANLSGRALAQAPRAGARQSPLTASPRGTPPHLHVPTEEGACPRSQSQGAAGLGPRACAQSCPLHCQALQLQGQQMLQVCVLEHSLSSLSFGAAACGILVPRPGIEPAPPASETWSLNHCTPGKSLFSFC